MTWQYGDYTVWNWASKRRGQPRRCRTRAMKLCQKLVNRTPQIRGSNVVELVDEARKTMKARTSDKK